MITGARQKTFLRKAAALLVMCLLVLTTACGTSGVSLLSGNEGAQYSYTEAQALDAEEISAQEAGRRNVGAAHGSEEQAPADITPDDGELFYTDEGGLSAEETIKRDGIYQQNMIASTGYFNLNLNGTNGEHTTVTTIELKVDAGEDGVYDDHGSQKVSAKLKISGSNEHDLYLINQKTGRAVTETDTTTVQASTGLVSQAEQNPLVSSVTSDGKTIYKTKSHCVINLQFQYTHPAYTYAVAGSSLNIDGGRGNYRSYQWDNNGRSTLSDIVSSQDRTETFWVQINLGNCGIIGNSEGKAFHATMNVNLNHPQLTVKYNGNGGTIGNSGTTKVAYNSPAKRPKSFSGLALSREGYTKRKNAEWNTRADGSGASFTSGTAYPASSYKNFDFARGVSYAAMKNSLSVTLYAQWTPNAAAADSYQVRLHVNKPAGSMLASIWANASFSISHLLAGQPTDTNGDGTVDGTLYGATAQDGVYLYKTADKWKKNGDYKSAGLQQSANFSVAGYELVKPEGAIKYGWYTEPDGGDYISMDSTVYTNDLSRYAYYEGKTAVVDLYAHWRGTGNIYINNNGGSYALYTGGGETAPWGKAYRTGDQVVFAYAGSGWYNTPGMIQSYPYREGYAFQGWSATDASGSELDDGCIRIGGSGTYGGGEEIPAYLFDSTGCTGDIWITAQWKNITHTLTVDNNGGAGYVIDASGQPSWKETWSKTYQEGSGTWFSYTNNTYDTGSPIQTLPRREGYTFLGWSVSDTHTGAVLHPAAAAVPDAYLEIGGGGALYLFTGAYDGDVTITAQWGKDCTIILDPNGGRLPDGATEPKALSPKATAGKNSWCDVSGQTPVRGTSIFLGWYTEPGYDAGVQVYDASGRCTNEGTYWKDSIWQYEGGENVTFYAHYLGFQLNVLAGDEHVTSVSAGTGGESQTHATNVSLYVQPGETVTVGAAVGELYDFYGWTGNSPEAIDAPERKNDFYTFTMPDHDVTLTAHSTDGTYKIIFDPNGGEGHIDDIYPALLTGPVTLPAVTADGPYTHRNENGPSTFIGWDTDAGHYPADCAYANGATVDALTDEHYQGEEHEPQGVVVLYAVWDECPYIVAYDRYYTLEQAQNGEITLDELMSHATATDREDGLVPPGGDVSKGNDFTIIDYQPTDFTVFEHDGWVTETYQVTDSAGNIYKKMVTIHVVDCSLKVIKPTKYTRFINEKYYNTPYEYGGLPDHSIWKTNPEYRAIIEQNFEHQRNGTYIMRFELDHETILQMKAFTTAHGVGNAKYPGALKEFYNRFLAPNKVG